MARRLVFVTLTMAGVAGVIYLLLRTGTDDRVPGGGPALAAEPDPGQPSAPQHAEQTPLRTAVADTATKGTSTVETVPVQGRVLDALTSVPLAGATVTVTAADVSAAVARAHDRAGATGVAGSDGAWLVRLPRADDSHWVKATQPGYLPCLRMLAAEDQVGASGTGGFDLALLPRAHGARLVGRVADEQGAPLGEARVAATGQTTAAHPERGWRFEGEQQTDALGRFAVEQIPPGPLRLVVARPGFTPLDQGLELGPGTTHDVGTLVLYAATASPAATAVLRGTVTDAQARAMPEVKVSLSGTWTKTVTTNAQGSYRVAGIPPQELTVTLTATGQPDFTFERAFAPGEEVVFDHRFAAASHFVGGSVIDGAEPLEGLDVSCRLATVVSGIKGRTVWRTATDSKGRFRLEGLPDGPVDLLLEWPWSRGVYRDLLVRGVSLDRDDHRLRFSVPRSVPILGTVRTADGAPVVGALVEPQAGGARGQGPNARGLSGPDGAFRVEVALSNQQSITLQVTKTGHATAVRFFVLGETSAEHTIAWDVLLAREEELATIAGRVTEAGGKPVAGARCQVHRTGAGVRAEELDVTASDGRYRRAGIAPGRLVVSIEHAWHGRFTQELVLAPGERATVDAVLDALTFTDLRLVLAGAGGPAAGEEVTVVCRHPPRLERSSVDAQGTLALLRWPIAATEVVVAATPAHAELHAQVRAEQIRGGTLRLTVRGGSGVVQGTLRSRAGHPIVGELITLQSKTSDGLSAFEETWTDQEGRFRVTGLADGVYVVGVAMSPRTVEVHPDGKPLTLVFP